MFGRYSDRAQRVILLAQKEARRLNYAHVSTEHLLLGLLREDDGLAARALKNLGVELDELRSAIERDLGQGNAPPAAQPQFTPRSKKVIMELSLAEAQTLGHAYVGTEHLLLGLIQEGECTAARLLEQAGVEGDRVRAEVVGLLGSEPGQPAATRRGPAGPARTNLRTLALVLDAEGSVLLVRRRLPVSEANWHLPEASRPGGPGELTRDGAIRAVREWAGLPVVCERLLRVTERVRGPVTDLGFYYLMRPEGAARVPEGIDTAYRARDQVPDAILPAGVWDALTAGAVGPDPWEGERTEPGPQG